MSERVELRIKQDLGGCVIVNIYIYIYIYIVLYTRPPTFLSFFSELGLFGLSLLSGLDLGDMVVVFFFFFFLFTVYIIYIYIYITETFDFLLISLEPATSLLSFLNKIIFV